jgi:hypothetical protein
MTSSVTGQRYNWNSLVGSSALPYVLARRMRYVEAVAKEVTMTLSTRIVAVVGLGTLFLAPAAFGQSTQSE